MVRLLPDCQYLYKIVRDKAKYGRVFQTTGKGEEKQDGYGS